MEIEENPILIGICPSCGKPMRIEAGSKEEGEDKLHCADICKNPAAMPTGARLMPDQATLFYTDGNMVEYTRDEYIKNHGIDPDPIWKAMQKWREEQIEKWKMRV
jgi:hypothetical protein